MGAYAVRDKIIEADGILEDLQGFYGMRNTVLHPQEPLSQALNGTVGELCFAHTRAIDLWHTQTLSHYM